MCNVDRKCFISMLIVVQLLHVKWKPNLKMTHDNLFKMKKSKARLESSTYKHLNIVDEKIYLLLYDIRDLDIYLFVYPCFHKKISIYDFVFFFEFITLYHKKIPFIYWSLFCCFKTNHIYRISMNKLII